MEHVMGMRPQIHITKSVEEEVAKILREMKLPDAAVERLAPEGTARALLELRRVHCNITC